jgi:hypothetical protein
MAQRLIYQRLIADAFRFGPRAKGNQGIVIQHHGNEGLPLALV